jgi:hypothetical protein
VTRSYASSTDIVLSPALPPRHPHLEAIPSLSIVKPNGTNTIDPARRIAEPGERLW